MFSFETLKISCVISMFSIIWRLFSHLIKGVNWTELQNEMKKLVWKKRWKRVKQGRARNIGNQIQRAHLINSLQIWLYIQNVDLLCVKRHIKLFKTICIAYSTLSEVRQAGCCVFVVNFLASRHFAHLESELRRFLTSILFVI